MATEKDTLTKRFMERPDVFADVFNFLIYEGEPVIKPDELKALDTTEIAIPYGADSFAAPEQKFRDVFKSRVAKMDGRAAYLLLGVENQSDIHYAMPVRNMVYDALQYSAQVAAKAKEHRRERKELKELPEDQKVTSGEYLSGFYRSDRLIPVITLVIYFGANEWDAPLTIHEMLEDSDEKILRLTPDYRINLICPASLTEQQAEKLSSELREVMLFVKYSRNKAKLKEILRTDEHFKAINIDTAQVIKALTGSNIRINQSEEEINMCQAIEEMRTEALEQGIEQGIQRGKEIGMEQGKEIGMAQGKEIGIQQGKEIGIEQGIEQGKEIGREQGREQGMEQGKEIGIKGIVAILRSMNIGSDEICEKIMLTYGLSREDAVRYASAAV